MKNDKKSENAVRIEGKIVTLEPLVISDDGSRLILILTKDESGKCLGKFDRSIKMNVGDLVEVKGESKLSSAEYATKKIPYADIISICGSKSYFFSSMSGKSLSETEAVDLSIAYAKQNMNKEVKRELYTVTFSKGNDEWQVLFNEGPMVNFGFRIDPKKKIVLGFLGGA